MGVIGVIWVNIGQYKYVDKKTSKPFTNIIYKKQIFFIIITKSSFL
jgi:hypothetical protein